MRDWAIYYDNGSVFDSDDGLFAEAPTDGVIIIANRRGDNIEFISGADYYVRFAEDGSIIGTEDIDSIVRTLGWVKFGRYTSHSNQRRITERASKEWKHGA